jgi:hypothetical protein
MEASIRTHSGQTFYYDKPEDFEYSLADIGYALGNICRFVGQAGWWSVAQHSLLVSELVEPKDKLRGLLHDAAEAFVTDLPSALKHMPQMTFYRELDKRITKAIYRQFGVPEDKEANKRVKQMDILAYEMESKLLGRGKVYEELAIDVPLWIRALNNGEAGREFERRAVWLMEQ